MKVVSPVRIVGDGSVQYSALMHLVLGLSAGSSRDSIAYWGRLWAHRPPNHLVNLYFVRMLARTLRLYLTIREITPPPLPLYTAAELHAAYILYSRV